MQGYLDLPEFSKIELSQVEGKLDELLAEADKKIALLEKVSEPSWDNFLYELDETVDEIQRFYSPCLLYTSPSPRDQRGSRMPSSA